MCFGTFFLASSVSFLCVFTFCKLSNSSPSNWIIFYETLLDFKFWLLVFFRQHETFRSISCQMKKTFCSRIVSKNSPEFSFFNLWSPCSLICSLWWNFAPNKILQLLCLLSLSLHTVTTSIHAPPRLPLSPLLHCISIPSSSLAAFVCCLRVWLCPPLRLSHSLSVAIPLCPFTSGRVALGASDSAPN